MLELVPQKPEVMCPVGAAKERLHQAKSMTPLCTGNRERAFSPVTGDCRVDGILQRAASYTSGVSSGSIHFWQGRTPVLGMDMAVSSWTASVKPRDNLLSKPGCKIYINKSLPNV